MQRSILSFILVVAAPLATAQDVPYCGDEGVWLQILGSGGTDLDDQRGGASYLVWIDENVRLMVDVGSAAALRFDQSGAAFADLDAIVFTKLQARSLVDFPSLIEGSRTAFRERTLPVYGPAVPGGDSLSAMIQRLMGTDGAFPRLAPYLDTASPAGYRISVREVTAIGTRRWSEFGNERLTLSAVPVNHGDIPALAWRVDIGDVSLVFAGSFSNQNGVIARFAKDADALIVHHAILNSARGASLDYFATPTELARVATLANVRMLVLGHRTTPTLGVESISRGFIEEHYGGPLIFGDEMECWGM